MNPRIIEVKELKFEERKPPEDIVFSYDPYGSSTAVETGKVKGKSFFGRIKSFFKI